MIYEIYYTENFPLSRGVINPKSQNLSYLGETVIKRPSVFGLESSEVISRGRGPKKYDQKIFKNRFLRMCLKFFVDVVRVSGPNYGCSFATEIL